MPTAVSTAKSSQTSPGERTASGDVMTAASTRLVAIRSVRRRIRSARLPMNGPARVGAQAQKPTRAARLLEPVSSFTQTPEARSMAESPKPETITPAR
ncbi:hypothetical protein GCM10010406_22280 [Streptomyces thermolineatus]|uniref:Uncharacterized protein n=1 Tax=Streptomyces thermolineatus TaxID=44033 RepID=A0ABN3LPB6_9ACTN